MPESEIYQTVEVLKKLEPGFFSYDIFVQLARLVVMPIIEIVPLRMTGLGSVEVLLLSRGSDDPIWPNMVHTPGTVIRATDDEDDMFGAFKRILETELGGTKISVPYFVGSIFHHSRRGAEQAQVYWVEVLESPRVGKFYSMSALPDNLIALQRGFMEQAARSYAAHKHAGTPLDILAV